MTEVSVSEAQQGLGALVQRAATSSERVTITNDSRQAAVLLGADELADLEDALALARYRARRALEPQTRGIPHDEARARLGIPRP